MNKDDSQQHPPCSRHCYSHVTHPCERCGRLQGYPAPKYSELKKKNEEMTLVLQEISELVTSRGHGDIIREKIQKLVSSFFKIETPLTDAAIIWDVTEKKEYVPVHVSREIETCLNLTKKLLEQSQKDLSVLSKESNSLSTEEEPTKEQILGKAAAQQIEATQTGKVTIGGKQFVCPTCGWKSSFPEEFIQEYRGRK